MALRKAPAAAKRFPMPPATARFAVMSLPLNLLLSICRARHRVYVCVYLWRCSLSTAAPFRRTCTEAQAYLERYHHQSMLYTLFSLQIFRLRVY